MPSLRALEVLVSLADTGSISAAARSLHLSQPAVSHQVAALERELGVRLVDRGPVGATMTRAGRACVDHARAAVASAERAVAAATAADAVQPLRLAVAESFTLPFLVPVVTRWRAEERPPLRLVETASASAAIAALRSGDLDLVVVPGPVPSDGLRGEVLGIEEVVAVGPNVPGGQTSPLSPVPIARIAAEGELVGVDDANGFHGWLTEQCAAAGVVYRPHLQTRSVQQAAALAAAGFGTALVPRSALGAGMIGIATIPALDREIVAVTRVHADGATAAFVDALRTRVTAVTRERHPASPRNGQ
ncbi:MAG: LysR family transcriptional regulator [Microbacterium arborescens]